MKRKIFSILFALVLATGLSLVTAVPVAAEAPTVTLRIGGDGTAEWSDVEAHSGKYSVYLHAGTEGLGTGAIRMMVAPIAVADFTGVSFNVWEPTGIAHGGEFPGAWNIAYPYGDPYIIILLDTIGDGEWDVPLIGVGSYPPAPAENTWVEMSEAYGFRDEGNLNEGIAPENQHEWYSEMVLSDPPGHAVWRINDVGTIEEWKTWLDANVPGTTVVGVQLQFGSWLDFPLMGVYVDDVTISGVTYDLQPPLSLDASFYQTDDVVTVTVIDPDANAQATVQESVAVNASIDSPANAILLGLLETGVNTGVFTETFTLVDTTPGTGELLVSHGSTITVAYNSDTDTAGVDNVAPVISPIVSPTASSNITDATPDIEAGYSDVGPSGIDITSVVMTVDGSAVAATVLGGSANWTSTANLTEGSHDVTVGVSDKAGNAATQKSWSFTVDTLAPVITLQVATPPVIPPVETEVVFTATVTDATSGVATVKINLSPVDGTVALAMLDDGEGDDAAAGDNIYTASENITKSAQADYNLTVTATDEVTNEATAVITLGVWSDIKDPVITDPAITYEYGSSARPGDTVTISANVTDNIGVDNVTAACTAFTATIDLLDGGVLPDVTPGDDIYTGTATVATGTSGDYTVTITAKDAVGNETTDVTQTLDVNPVATGYDIALYEGWNLISLPLIPTDDSIDVVLADISDNVSQVRTFVYVDGVLTEKFWMEGGAVGLLDEMVDGQGYWIEMTEAKTLTVQGSELPGPGEYMPEYDVYEGWNLIGFKSVDASTAEAYLGGAVTLIFERMYGYDAAGGVYTVIQPTIPNLEPGQGYWLAVSAAGTIYP